jgi:hypothetical protein
VSTADVDATGERDSMGELHSVTTYGRYVPQITLGESARYRITAYVTIGSVTYGAIIGAVEVWRRDGMMIPFSAAFGICTTPDVNGFVDCNISRALDVPSEIRDLLVKALHNLGVTMRAWSVPWVKSA